MSGVDLHERLQLQTLDVLKIASLGIAAAIDTRNDSAEVERSSIERSSRKFGGGSRN